MNVWSLSEIEECRQGLYAHVSAEQAAGRYCEFGGAVRSVLAKQERTFAQLRAEVGAENTSALISVQDLGSRSKFSHTLAHFHVSDLTFIFRGMD